MCIREIGQPIKEEYLLSGYLEQTNEPYAIAKIAGIKMRENYNRQYKTNYKCLMPTNNMDQMILMILKNHISYQHNFKSSNAKKKL